MSATPSPASIRSAEVVLSCADVSATLAFFTDRLGFRIDEVFPADEPRETAISGHGLQLRLVRGGDDAGMTLRLVCDPQVAVAPGGVLTAPNGTRVELVAPAAYEMPALAPELVITRLGAESEWVTGRAGMKYRDLIPGRLGGRFIASHIRIPEGGPVPDYVHFHRVRFQMIHCLRGSVRLVYEDQGEPFVLAAGDTVLQPPEIRHRVLECSDGLEVVEISSPAEHVTAADHDLTLPTSELRPERTFTGQRFVRHVAAAALWEPDTLRGFSSRDTGLAEATGGLADARIVRAETDADPSSALESYDSELRFVFVRAGRLELRLPDGRVESLHAGDCATLPAGLPHALSGAAAASTQSAEFLLVTIPPSATATAAS